MLLTPLGHINLHKERRPDVLEDIHLPQQGSGSFGQRPRGSSHAYPNDRGRYRGARSSRGFTHRHRSLILNQTGERNGRSEAPDASFVSQPDHSNHRPNQEDNKSVTPSHAWVSKRDRHMQLINSSIYDHKTSIRNKAMEQTRQHKKLRKETREKQKINRHLQLSATSAVPALTPHYLVISGVSFQVCNEGSKLARDKSEAITPRSTRS